MEKNHIQIGDKKFGIAKLTLGQIDELSTEFGIKVKELTTDTFRAIVEASIDNACKFFAIILTEDGVELYNKDIAQLTKYLKYNLHQEKIEELLSFFLKYGKQIWSSQKEDSAKIHTLPKKK